MSLLFNVLFAWKCKNTHHKLALDALTQLRCPGAAAWQPDTERYQGELRTLAERELGKRGG